jgi:hypothetical protein
MVIFVFDSAAQVFGSLLVIITIVILGMFVKLHANPVHYSQNIPKIFTLLQYLSACLHTTVHMYNLQLCTFFILS